MPELPVATPSMPGVGQEWELGGSGGPDTTVTGDTPRTTDDADTSTTAAADATKGDDHAARIAELESLLGETAAQLQTAQTQLLSRPAQPDNRSIAAALIEAEDQRRRTWQAEQEAAREYA